MSIKIENHCVDCGLPCLGDNCKYKKVPVSYCDYCGDNATVRIDEEDFCLDCANKKLIELFNEFDICTRASIVNVSFREFE